MNVFKEVLFFIVGFCTGNYIFQFLVSARKKRIINLLERQNCFLADINSSTQSLNKKVCILNNNIINDEEQKLAWLGSESSRELEEIRCEHPEIVEVVQKIMPLYFK